VCLRAALFRTGRAIEEFQPSATPAHRDTLNIIRLLAGGSRYPGITPRLISASDIPQSASRYGMIKELSFKRFPRRKRIAWDGERRRDGKTARYLYSVA